MDKKEVVSSERVLFTASSFAKQALFHLQEIGSLTAMQPHTNARSGLRSFLFFYVLEGAGSLSYEGQTWKLEPGNCVWIDCSRSYAHWTGPDLWTIRWIHFYGTTVSAVYERYRENGGKPVFYVSGLDTVSRIWAGLMEEAVSADPLREMRINQHLSELLVRMMEAGGRPREGTTPPKRGGLEEVRKYLEEHSAEKISVEELAARFLLSPSYLAHSFKARFGMSVTAYLLSIRITRAKRLLRFSEKSVEEIGYETGIGAPAYFSRVFRHVEGMTPSQFREQW